jgi:hypothetical protein
MQNLLAEMGIHFFEMLLRPTTHTAQSSLHGLMDGLQFAFGVSPYAIEITYKSQGE